jgi:hypothetical protein
VRNSTVEFPSMKKGEIIDHIVIDVKDGVDCRNKEEYQWIIDG